MKRLSFLLFLFPTLVFAQSPVTSSPILDIDTRRSFFQFSSGFTQVSTEDESTSGLDFGVSYLYGFQDQVAVMASVRQAVNLSGFGTVYTEIGAGLAFAFGSLSFVNSVEKVSIDGSTVTTLEPFTAGGFLLTGQLKQFLFNGTSSVIPIVGTGIGAYYIFGSSSLMNMHIGGNFSYGQNDDTDILSIGILVGAQFWL